MRDESFLRGETRWLVERARVALGLDHDEVRGLADEQIDMILEAQGVEHVPPALDELMRLAGVYSTVDWFPPREFTKEEMGATKTLLGELMPGTGLGMTEMLKAKEAAATTAGLTGLDLEFGSNVVVFRTHPDGRAWFMELGSLDPAVWMISESDAIVRSPYPRLACRLESSVVRLETSASGVSNRIVEVD